MAFVGHASLSKGQKHVTIDWAFAGGFCGCIPGVEQWKVSKSCDGVSPGQF